MALQTHICRDCRQSLDPNLDHCPNCNCPNPLDGESGGEAEVCWICGRPSTGKPDMEGKATCDAHFVQTCWMCLEPVRRSAAWRLRTRKSVYYFHPGPCYAEGKKKLRKNGRWAGIEQITCDPRDPQRSFRTRSGCLGLFLLLLGFLTLVAWLIPS